MTAPEKHLWEQLGSKKHPRTQNDGVNLQIALKTRSLIPDIHVAVRVFNDGFARALNEQFGFQALSAMLSASPIFAASAVGLI